MEPLKVSLLQPEMRWEDTESNLKMYEKLVGRVDPGTHLVLLPETFSTGFTMNAERYAEGEDGPTLQWMRHLASTRRIHLTGSLIYREKNGDIYNRLFWVSPRGIEGWYDKRHLFRMGRENAHYTRGVDRRVFRMGDWRLFPQICYDIRFPVFARNRNDYDILFYVANWPASRQNVWETLLRARAIENQAYVLGVNRTGMDGEGVDHTGGSCVIDPMGRSLECLDHSPGILNVSLSLEDLQRFREKFPAWKDADPFSLDQR